MISQSGEEETQKRKETLMQLKEEREKKQMKTIEFKLANGTSDSLTYF